MNNKRRQKLCAISEKITIIRGELEDIRGEEQCCMDCIPENLQNSDRYLQSEEICDMLSELDDQLYDIIDMIDEIVSM